MNYRLGSVSINILLKGTDEVVATEAMILNLIKGQYINNEF